MQIKLTDIKITHLRRPRDEKTIEELAKSMAEIGLLNPITLGSGYELIAGMHRLAAARKLGWTEIDCTLFDHDGLKAKLAELDENLIRNEGNAIERGEWLNERKQIYESLYPETKREATLKQNQSNRMAESAERAKSFVQDVSEKTGIPERTIRQDIQIGRDTISEVKQLAKEVDMTKTQALKFARLPAEKQKEIAQPIIAHINTLAPEERKEGAYRLIEKQFNESDEAKQIDKERQIFSMFGTPISRVLGWDMSAEALEIYFNELLVSDWLDNGLENCYSAIENLETLKNYLEKRRDAAHERA